MWIHHTWIPHTGHQGGFAVTEVGDNRQGPNVGAAIEAWQKVCRRPGGWQWVRQCRNPSSCFSASSLVRHLPSRDPCVVARPQRQPATVRRAKRPRRPPGHGRWHARTGPAHSCSLSRGRSVPQLTDARRFRVLPPDRAVRRCGDVDSGGGATPAVTRRSGTAVEVAVRVGFKQKCRRVGGVQVSRLYFAPRSTTAIWHRGRIAFLLYSI